MNLKKLFVCVLTAIMMVGTVHTEAMAADNSQIVTTAQAEAKTAQAALDAAFRKYGPSATVLAMPHGGSTLPYLQDAGPDHSRT